MTAPTLRRHPLLPMFRMPVAVVLILGGAAIQGFVPVYFAGILLVWSWAVLHRVWPNPPMLSPAELRDADAYLRARGWRERGHASAASLTFSLRLGVEAEPPSGQQPTLGVELIPGWVFLADALLTLRPPLRHGELRLMWWALRNRAHGLNIYDVGGASAVADAYVARAYRTGRAADDAHDV